ncbi:hypothetical protein EOA32_06895 [Mesorhizobium sp. M1A.F.Ca.ET.072.01.1.1]|uniref:phosphopantetheine-binding protein n=1 Tax=Mesorhizobium sp. M1A.F.Ca.ET.072.01.1.1 TaxID=2496753 RepID=UPI000FD5AB43|nr:phosphopantetheine-binding protein [Mesorhizobium sp. M1A.F.Ca.ET.072.01.1.1]RUW54076.1 hypothetical protein EOA32_06895 [Mesorhizobium sp. M1A.F.Ca.ET.072.01.1.1]TIV04057.1 MAG: hypothetical protein E5W04_05330 [Mesorhizobium sp.]
MKETDPRSLFLEEIKCLLGSQNVKLEDNFFDLGGDSLLAAELQVLLTKSDRWRPPQLADIFEATTFGELYDRICINNPHQPR